MATKRQSLYNMVKLFILFVFLLSLVTPASIVFADDAPPPAETSEVVDSQVEGETPPEDEAVPDGDVPEDEESVADETAAEEAVGDDTDPESEELVGEEPAAVEAASEDIVPEESAVDEPAPEGEIQIEKAPALAQVPDGTDVVVVDEEGEVVPLATQEAAEAIASSDPMWCPDGVDPIANTDECTDNYSSMTDLLAALAGGNQPNESGTIWIDATYDSSVAEPSGTTNIIIDGDNYSTWRNYSLTVQGGWDGAGTNTVSSTSLFFGDRLMIVDWRNDVTVNNLVLNGASGGASLQLEIDTLSTNTYDITVEDVEIKNNSDNRGAYIDNDESTGSVTVNNSRFTDNNSDGVYIDSRGSVLLSNVIATGNTDEGVQIINVDSSSQAPVQVLGTNVFSGNSGNGLEIRSEGAISLNNITADNNGNLWCRVG